MGTNAENRVALAQVPTDSGSDEFGVLRIDSDNTHRVTALPASWSGRIVRFNVLTAATTVDVACSPSPTAEVDGSVAPADNAVSTKVGLRLAPNVPERLRLPKWDRIETMYLVHEASAANTTLEVALLT